MIEKTLQNIGLSSTEATIYLAILEHGRTNTSTIARQTGIKRTTVYMAASSLVEKGIVQQDISGTTRYYIAEPEWLTNYTKKEQAHITEQEKSIKSLMPELLRIPQSKNSISIPKVRFIDQFELESFLYERMPLWEQSMLDTNEPTFWGFQDHSFVENAAYSKWVDWYWPQANKHIDLKLLTNSSKAETKIMAKKDLPKRHIKFWQGKEKFTATQWIMGEYIVNIVTDQKPHYMVEIRDKLLAENLRNLYKHLWDS